MLSFLFGNWLDGGYTYMGISSLLILWCSSSLATCPSSWRSSLSLHGFSPRREFETLASWFREGNYRLMVKCIEVWDFQSLTWNPMSTYQTLVVPSPDCSLSPVYQLFSVLPHLRDLFKSVVSLSHVSLSYTPQHLPSFDSSHSMHT